MNAIHILRKELRNYFSSPIAYVFFAFFLFIVGYYFYLIILGYGQRSMYASQYVQLMTKLNPVDSILSPMFNLRGFLLIFLIPVLTMRLFAEEKKLGTIELLFTYPITEMHLIAGKMVASIIVMMVIFGFSFVFMVVYNNYFNPAPWSVIFCGYLGLFLLSLAFISFGMWISSLTSDLVTAALGTIGGLLIFWVIGSGRMTTTGLVSDIMAQVSMVEHFQRFSKGILDSHDVVYFACFIFFFAFLTLQVLEIRKWKG
jgi:ABC-2 type transport system permease protein